MSYFDVFNGDADGICALQQLRLANPVESHLVTGVKRDIDLLRHVQSNENDRVCVLDISLDKNRNELIRILHTGAEVQYFDHHFAGDIPVNKKLDTHIDTDAEICTSLLVNRYLKGKHLPWAVTGTYGDNLYDSAKQAAKPLKLSDEELEQLKTLGTCINYNGYGATLDDLLFKPVDLYLAIRPYVDPFEFIRNEAAYDKLETGYYTDLEQVASLSPSYESDSHALYVLPSAKWARRVSGVFANQLARQNPGRAHAMLTEVSGGYVVSVRAPLENKTGADELCRKFPTGGGRAAAAGINHLPNAQFDTFLSTFKLAF